MSTTVENQTDDAALDDDALENVAGGRGTMTTPNLMTRTVSLNGPNSHGSAQVSPLGVTKLEWSYDSTSGGTRKK